jgi:hypothetical protein
MRFVRLPDGHNAVYGSTRLAETAPRTWHAGWLAWRGKCLRHNTITASPPLRRVRPAACLGMVVRTA